MMCGTVSILSRRRDHPCNSLVGAGVGGHCLTKDTYHLERGVKVLGGHLDCPAGKDSLIVLARNINDFMPRHMFTLTMQGLEWNGKTIRGSKIASLGGGVHCKFGDDRNTPAEACLGTL